MHDGCSGNYDKLQEYASLRVEVDRIDTLVGRHLASCQARATKNWTKRLSGTTTTVACRRKATETIIALDEMYKWTSGTTDSTVFKIV